MKIKIIFKPFLTAAILLAAVLLASCENSLIGPVAKAPLPSVQQSQFAAILDSLRYSLDLPALSAAIVTDTGIVEAKAVGCRRYGGPANVTDNDQFMPGSCGKSFTAAVIGTLVDEGLLNWNTTLPEIFPEYIASMRNEYKSVTIKNLLSHSAGIVYNPELNLNSSIPCERRIEVVEWALQQPPVQPKGKYQYSNVGYIIAGAIAEKLANRSYEELVIDRICNPLGMTTAGFGVPGTEGKEDQPLQHTVNHAPIIAMAGAELDPVQNPAGARLHMSIGDWGKYCRWVLAFEAGRHQTILKNATAHTLTTPVVESGGGGYDALGWGVSYPSWSGGKSLQHSGSNGYNYAVVMLAPDSRFGILAMTNQGKIYDEWVLGPVFWRLLDYYKNGK